MPRPGGLPLPETVLDAVLLRTEVLSLAGRNALETAAVAGHRCVVANVPSLERAEGLGEALSSGLLVEDGRGCVAFRHALVRDAIYHAVPWTRRRSLHAAIAAALEEVGGSPAERARHWLGAGNVERARSALAEAAAASADVYAYRDAAELYERALDLDGGTEAARFDLLERLAVCAELAGDLARSARAWREVIDGRRGRGEVERVAEAQESIGRVLALRGSNERALIAWAAAAEAFEACGRDDDAVRSRLAAAHLLQVTANLRSALAVVEAAVAEPARRLAARAPVGGAIARGRGARQARAHRRCPRGRARGALRVAAAGHARRPRPPTRRSPSLRERRRFRPGRRGVRGRDRLLRDHRHHRDRCRSARPACATSCGSAASGGAASSSATCCSTIPPSTTPAAPSRVPS